MHLPQTLVSVVARVVHRPFRRAVLYDCLAAAPSTSDDPTVDIKRGEHGYRLQCMACGAQYPRTRFGTTATGTVGPAAPPTLRRTAGRPGTTWTS